ncbi:uncharacterized protein LOC116061928 isoform X2 [Sander lucioperca]|uniref:uncharacterized protein LOC116061928 isoform X2 n=1 Tax=Sander lucioperca TaxID=283035 RepID=UPI001653D256|nr:uncharacterized protein LOC116061928 isoform X2 [Sander lucioperca]
MNIPSSKQAFFPEGAAIVRIYSSEMAKSHKAMGDSEWMARLRKFASTGAWPAGEGNRPAPRQTKWYELYQRIEKCPMQKQGQMSLFGQVRKCLCGFHTQKAAAGQQTEAPSPVQGIVAQHTAAVGLVQATVGQQSAALGLGVPGAVGHKQRPSFNLSMFTKPRFGGAHLDAAKPNLTKARPRIATQTQVNDPTDERASSSANIAVSAPESQTVPASAPVLSPVAVCATVSTADSRTETPEAVTSLPRLWSEGLPPEDHKWILKTVMKVGPKGKLQLQDHLKLWFFPPQPSPLYHQAPAPDRFFAHPLLVWMPYKLWKVKVVCPNPVCGQHQLTGGGLHKRARQVLDVDRIYNMVTETLTCTKCRSTHVSWSQTVLKQLDLAHRSEFRVILTQKGLGNSPTRVLKQLRENHTEEWLHRVARYTTECVDFLQRPGLLPMAFPEPPEPAVVPSCKWLLSVYSQDILTRVDDIKARITSTYGTILKMDSTKKITKKLAGTAKGTALWLTSVGNEYGQILISVLTAQEGAGLDMMTAGLVKRYQQAGVDPPVALYVDCGCCTEVGETKLQARFSGWPDLTIRLDIWHFMRRLALGCTTDAHQLYPIFMSRISACIFEWDAADLALLREAKKQQLLSQGLTSHTDDISRHLSREELALHCRRRTRGEETTTRLLEELLQQLIGTNGNDSLGVPLLDRERTEHIWRVQRKHIKCIQDPPGVSLYIRTGELTKGGVRLPMFRCARGSTSLESFHLHLNRFIPGTSANSLNFQVYLLEGLHRWNQDRGSAALSTGPSALRSYSGDLIHCVNQHFEKLFSRKMVPDFCPPSRYTGELIGIQYLFRQTGQALQDMHPDSEETAQLVEEHNMEDNLEEDEGFSDVTDDPTVLLLEVQASASSSSATSTLAPSSSATSTLAPSSSATSTLAPSSSATSTLAPSSSATSTLAPSSSATSTLAPSSSATSTLAPSSSATSTLAPSSSATSTLAPSSSATSTLAPSTSAMASGASILPSSSSSEAGVDAQDEDMAVDDRNIPGYQYQ